MFIQPDHSRRDAWRRYFWEQPVEPEILKAAIKECENSDANKPELPYASQAACTTEAIDAAGGIPVFGSASIDITNAQSASILITEVRSVVEKRISTSFEAYYAPELGGPIGTSLGFNLDEDTFRGRLMTEAENVVPPLTPPPSVSRTPYFQQTNIEVESGRVQHLFVAAMSTFQGIVEWHLEIEYQAMDADGKTQVMTAVVRPPDGPFKGARSAGTVAQTRSCLICSS